MIRLRCHGLTDPGLERSRNEDALEWSLDAKGGCLVAVVADGVGGAPAGDQASRLACRTICGQLHGHAGTDIQSPLPAAVREAHAAVRRDQAAHPERQGMATTVVALLARGPQACLAHVGDSRAYRWRDGALERLTRDHTLAQEMVDNGALPPDRSDCVPYSQVLSRALGAGERVEVEHERLELLPGDRYLLCSDGLFRAVGEGRMAALVGAPGPPERRVSDLVEAANAAGGPDNITVFLLDVVEE